MTPGRYIRVHKGQIVCARHDLQGVIGHLHDLARHLEGLMPVEDAIDVMTRARDFSGGFAARAEHERALDGAVLDALAERTADHPYEPVYVEGYSAEQVESAVLRLWKCGLVDAHSLMPKQVTPGAVTTRGFQALQKTEKTLATKGRAR